MENKRKKQLWILVVILVIIGIFILIWFLTKPDLAPTAEPDTTTDNQPRFEITSPEFEPVKINPQDSVEFTVSNLARNFADRFGSWSTDNQGQNLQDLFSLSSAKMRAQLQNVNLDYQTEEFLGVTTKALSTKTLFLDEIDGEANIEVQTQRVETKADLSQNTYYQTAAVSIIRSGDNWLVDEFDWQE